MSNLIPPIPPIPDGLREARQRGTLAPFVGAGASRIAGCPGWSDFADSALKFFVDQQKLSHGELAQIRTLNPRVRLSIARQLQRRHSLPINFDLILHKSNKDSLDKGKRLYGSLSKLASTFVTTNYDRWLDDEVAAPVYSVDPDQSLEQGATRKRHVLYRLEDLAPSKLNQRNTVIHLHGSVEDPSGMVLTTRDYIEHYANDRSAGNPERENRVLTFLEYLFANKTVLFIGYGLDELEILEYVILKARQLKTGEARHYLLQGFFAHEHELMRSLKNYYLAECGIELIPFLRDHKDWDQLLDVLDEFARHLPASEPMVLQEFNEMEAMLNE